jgi:hypothetical protein
VVLVVDPVHHWPLRRLRRVGVQVDYNVVHHRTSLVQLFVLLLQNFEKVVQMIELKRFGGAPNGYPFAPLPSRPRTCPASIVMAA